MAIMGPCTNSLIRIEGLRGNTGRLCVLTRKPDSFLA
jgi:hypothetical protein